MIRGTASIIWKDKTYGGGRKPLTTHNKPMGGQKNEYKSGKTVKCPIDTISYTVGKAGKAGYFIVTKKFEDINNIIHSTVML